MKTISGYCRMLFSLMLICLVLCGCNRAEAPAIAETTVSATVETVEIVAPVTAETTEPVAQEAVAPETIAPAVEGSSISVAVYPYIPDVALFREILSRQWGELEPDVALNFVEWDCYEQPDPAQIDIIMYDAMFASYLAEGGYIQPIPEDAVADKDGILAFAVEGARHEGQLYGIPYLVCSDFLIYHADDAEMAAVENMQQLCEVVSARKQKAPGDGLVVNYYSHYPYFYLDALIDFSGDYSVYEEAPVTVPPDPTVHARLRQIKQSLPNCEEDTILRDSKRAALFNDGQCSVYYGYSEDMSRMDDLEGAITVSTISFSETENIQLFYADIASMGAHVTDPAQQALCIKLMNLLGSETFQQELCFGSEDVQYMLPARKSVYDTAREQYPVYGRLQELALAENNRIFRFGKDVHTYLGTAYKDLA